MRRCSFFACALPLVATCVLTAIGPSVALAQFGFGGGGGHGGGHGGGYGGGHGGGGGMSFGIGGGGISIGSSGRSSGYGHGNSNYGSGWGVTVRPGSGYGNGYNNGYGNDQYNQPRYSEPRYSQPTTTSNNGQAKSTEAPVKPSSNVKPAYTDPKDNALQLVARQITPDEVKRAKDYFDKRLKELARTVELRLPAVEADIVDVLAALTDKEMDPDAQVRLIDALRAGRNEDARKIWISIFPDDPVPFGAPRMRVRLAGFITRLEAGGCTMADVTALESDLMGMGMAEEPCCGAESLLDDMEQYVQINQQIARAVPGDGNKPTAIPGGDVSVVYHPGMPDGNVVVLDAETVMIGTGGVGKFRTSQEQVASALGYPVSQGQSVPASDAKLVRSGTVLQNPTTDKVRYLIDRSDFALEPGFRQTLTAANSVITFDRGNGTKAAQYKLGQGTYRFAIKNRAWELVQSQFSVVVDNSGNAEPFQYICQGDYVTVPPGKTQSHKSDYPIVIRFDRGNGATVKQVVHDAANGTFEVAINPADNLWDLFTPSGHEGTEAPPKGVEKFTPAF